MKNQLPVKIAAPLEAWALSAIRARPGFDEAIRPDAEISIEGRSRPIVLEAKRRVDAAHAHAIVALARRTPVGRDFILVAERTSEGARHGYPPDKQEKATQTVLEQAEVLSEARAAA